jgi:hypothetical protein
MANLAKVENAMTTLRRIASRDTARRPGFEPDRVLDLHSRQEVERMIGNPGHGGEECVGCVRDWIDRNTVDAQTDRAKFAGIPDARLTGPLFRVVTVQADSQRWTARLVLLGDRYGASSTAVRGRHDVAAAGVVWYDSAHEFDPDDVRSGRPQTDEPFGPFACYSTLDSLLSAYSIKTGIRLERERGDAVDLDADSLRQVVEILILSQGLAPKYMICEDGRFRTVSELWTKQMRSTPARHVPWFRPSLEALEERRKVRRQFLNLSPLDDRLEQALEVLGNYTEGADLDRDEASAAGTALERCGLGWFDEVTGLIHLTVRGELWRTGTVGCSSLSWASTNVGAARAAVLDLIDNEHVRHLDRTSPDEAAVICAEVRIPSAASTVDPLEVVRDLVTAADRVKWNRHESAWKRRAEALRQAKRFRALVKWSTRRPVVGAVAGRNASAGGSK